MRFTHDPNANLDYTIDWSRYLVSGETISVSSWVVPAGVTKGSDTINSPLTTVWISGGTAGTSYSITNRITTSAGRIDDRTFTLICTEK